MRHNLFHSFQKLHIPDGRAGEYYALAQLEKEGVGAISRLPYSIRILLESVLRHCDGKGITEQDVVRLANWRPKSTRTEEIPFLPARILLQDFTGVPLLVDLAAMRSAVARLGRNVRMIEPLVPVDLIIDHSVQVDFWGDSDALQRNMEMELLRNRARYQFLKWGARSFQGFNVIPPGIGICHQVNLEHLARVVQERDGVYFPDTLVGTDSHTTMINGLGVLGWGVGGIEAESGMLGQPVYLLTPDVVGVRLHGCLKEGATATDLALRATEMLRKAKVVGKIVEFCGPGVAGLPVPDRATLSNMSPEYGATAGFFPVDEATCSYLINTGRPKSLVDAVRAYYKAQQMFGSPGDEVEYSELFELNLTEIAPSVAGPKRPQDRIALENLKTEFRKTLQNPVAEGGYRKPAAEIDKTFALPADCHPAVARSASSIEAAAAGASQSLRHGSVAIAAITSCTNTSNPNVMIAAGLMARKAVERGLCPPSYVKTSLAPGSRVVGEYLEKSGLQKYLDWIGFHLVGYGCTTCIGNSGPLAPAVEDLIAKNDLVLASVSSGNRNFEARIHPAIKANFLMSPPLVVAFALAGRVDIDLTREPLGKDAEGKDVYLRDLWPGSEEIEAYMNLAFDPDTHRRLYSNIAGQNELWNEIPSVAADAYLWDETSTYVREPPYFEDFQMKPEKISPIQGARPLAIFGDSATTDHISPAGSIEPASPAGRYLQQKGVEPADFNSYGSRRGNHEVMVRGTFANVRIRNRMAPGTEGGVTLYYPGGVQMSIYEASCKYREAAIPLVVLAGQEYGTGSSRDWAAKGTRLLGVRAVIAQSFERIHRSNLVGSGVLPCQFKEGASVDSLNLDGSEIFDLPGAEGDLSPRQDLALIIHRANGRTESVPVTLRIDTPVEAEHCKNGGILPYVLRRLL